jgi:hypothetical protein
LSGPPKTAIVTGASQGTGAGIAMGFVERGFTAEDWLTPGPSRDACLIKFVGGSTPDRSKLVGRHGQRRWVWHVLTLDALEVVIWWLSLLSPIVHATLALARSQSSGRRALDIPKPCARRSDDTEARHSQGTQGIDTEHSETGSCQKSKEDGGKPGVSFLTRSKGGTRSMPAWLIGGTRQRRRRFCASGWEETKEGAAVWWRSPKDGNWL